MSWQRNMHHTVNHIQANTLLLIPILVHHVLLHLLPKNVCRKVANSHAQSFLVSLCSNEQQ